MCCCLLFQVSQIEGVYNIQQPHFWTLCTDTYVGTLKLEVDAMADSQHIIDQTLIIFYEVNSCVSVQSTPQWDGIHCCVTCFLTDILLSAMLTWLPPVACDLIVDLPVIQVLWSRHQTASNRVHITDLLFVILHVLKSRITLYKSWRHCSILQQSSTVNQRYQTADITAPCFSNLPVNQRCHWE